MAEQKTAPVTATGANCFKEAVCIDAGRIYDSCTDKDCLTDLQVYFTDRAQPVIDNAISVKCKDVEILTAYLDVEPVPFNKGFYAVDITFFFKVTVAAYSSPTIPPATVVGVAAFAKKVILYGSDGNVKVYCSTDARNCCEHDNTNMPKASVHVVDPMCLDSKLVECGPGRMFDLLQIRRRFRRVQAAEGRTDYNRPVHHRSTGTLRADDDPGIRLLCARQGKHQHNGRSVRGL